MGAGYDVEIPELSSEHAGSPEVSQEPQQTTFDDQPAVEGSQEQVSQDQGQQQPQPAQPQWNGQEYALNFRGRQIVPRDRNHLINLAQQGYAYETRAQELARKEQEYAQKDEQYKQFAQLEQAFESNPIFKQQLMQLYQQSMSGQLQPQQQQVEGQQQVQGSPDYSPLLEKYQTLEQKLSQYEAAQADQELTKEIDTLKAKFQRNDWDMIDERGQSLTDAIMQHAYKLGGVPLETAYKDMMWEQSQQNAQAEALKNQAEQRQQQVKKGVVASPASKQVSAPTNQPVDLRSMNYNEIAKMAMSNR
jgi:hypothetical protein